MTEEETQETTGEETQPLETEPVTDAARLNEAETEAQAEPVAEGNIIASGQETDTISWTFDDAGVLTITGTGDIPNNSSHSWSVPGGVQNFSQVVKKVVIGEGITNVGVMTFINCASLTEVSLPSTLKSIGSSAFTNCGLETLTLPEGVEQCDFAFSSCASLQTVTLPSTLKSMFYAFADCSSLTSVVIPEGVEIIGELAFARCAALETITFPSTLKTIERSAFVGCGLKTLTLPEGLTSIKYDAFRDCTALGSVVIPDSVTTMERNIFGGCTALSSVTIGSGVTEIEGNIFGSCSALSEVKINGNPNYIVEDGAIYTSDKKVLLIYLIADERTAYTVPDSVTTISYAAFCDASLQEVSLPQNLREIERYAFAGAAIKEISLPANMEAIGKNVFRDSSCAKVYVYSKDVVLYAAFAEGATVFGYEGSTAQKFIEEKNYWNLTFRPFSEGSDAGYEILDSMPDIAVGSGESHTIRSNGSYGEFSAVYLDGRKLTAGEEYTSREGSTIVTISDRVLAANGAGVHTITIEFRAADNSVKRTIQNYTVKEAGNSGGNNQWKRKSWQQRKSRWKRKSWQQRESRWRRKSG